jgi:hypothetical protein
VQQAHAFSLVPSRLFHCVQNKGRLFIVSALAEGRIGRPLNCCTLTLHRHAVLLQVLNETFSQDLKQYLSPHFSLDDASFISIDATGADVRVRLGSEFNVERLGFESKVHSLDEAIAAVKTVLQEC